MFLAQVIEDTEQTITDKFNLFEREKNYKKIRKDKIMNKINRNQIELEEHKDKEAYKEEFKDNNFIKSGSFDQSQDYEGGSRRRNNVLSPSSRKKPSRASSKKREFLEKLEILNKERNLINVISRLGALDLKFNNLITK
mmetsp:Transcript_27929/g.24702  ORF Transcript_27929/g.24702 Transcript_27929/m.24702 type:complete len:139 (-) Transcript_27929:252-668(-)